MTERLPLSHRRMLNRCSLEWLALPLLVDRERRGTPGDAMVILEQLEGFGLLMSREGVALSDREWKLTDAGIMAVMENSPAPAGPGLNN